MFPGSHEVGYHNRGVEFVSDCHGSNNAGILDITIDLAPRIRQGHRISLYLDGEPVSGVPRAATSFTIDNVVRGVHTLRAAVEDREGNLIQETPTVRFYVQQVSLLNPNNPNVPRPTPRG